MGDGEKRMLDLDSAWSLNLKFEHVILVTFGDRSWMDVMRYQISEIYLVFLHFNGQRKLECHHFLATKT